MHTTSGTLRTLLVWTGLVITLAVLIQQLARFPTHPIIVSVDDFVVFWSAGRLNIMEGNPYNLDRLLSLQREAGRMSDIPLVMWYPPPVLTLGIPFGLLSYPVARLLWLILHFSIVLFCADWLWRFYGGSTERRWIAWIVGLTFVPTLSALKAGQIGPLVLLGVVGFLYFERIQKHWWAGASVALVAIKPLLLYLCWMALLLWMFRRRCWPVLLGMCMTCLAATAIALFINPFVIGQYRHMISSAPPAPPIYWITPTFGSVLRSLFGWEKVGLQFVPAVLGIIWFLFYWQKHQQSWNWGEQMPLLLFASIIFTAHGGLFDQVVLLVAVIQVAVWLHQSVRRPLALWTIASYAVLNGLALAFHVIPVSYLWCICVAPLLLILYLAARQKAGRGAILSLPSR